MESYEDRIRREDEHMKLMFKESAKEAEDEIRRIFPAHLVKKTLTEDTFFRDFIQGKKLTQINKDYEKYPFLKKYSALNDNGPKEDTPIEELPYSGLVDKTLYVGGAESKILGKTGCIKTKETYDYSPYEISKYALTDFGVDMMTNFIGCIPEESERCYSIIRHLSEDGEDIALGYSSSDLRGLVMKMVDSSRRLCL